MSMGLAEAEREEHEAYWRNKAINEWGHSPYCAVLSVGGVCDCKKRETSPFTTMELQEIDGKIGNEESNDWTVVAILSLILNVILALFLFF